jgi:GTP-binding protein HflX
MEDTLSGRGSVRAEKAFLTALVNRRGPTDGDPLGELRRLATDAGAMVIGESVQRRDRPVAATYFGKGKAEEIRDRAAEAGADLVIADNDLSPAQVKNLENIVELKVIDRTELILDIFASRARTLQARLQVELAQLEYTLPRLKRMWTHLSRIEGGIGMRGPGEKQIETDRRAANRKVRDLKKQLDEIRSRRRRTVQSRVDHFKVSLVGYTNAGKSTLMNLLTGAGVTVRDRLFETLDTRTRAWELPGGRRVLLSDTVGFIRKLPHSLVASFHATLEETRTADLLLIVMDVSDPRASEQLDAVRTVLDEIGLRGKPEFLVFNKADLPHCGLELNSIDESFESRVTVSAKTGEGVATLRDRITELYDEELVEIELTLGPDSGAAQAAVARSGRVISTDYTDQGVKLKALVRRSEERAIRRLAGG